MLFQISKKGSLLEVKVTTVAFQSSFLLHDGLDHIIRVGMCLLVELLVSTWFRVDPSMVLIHFGINEPKKTTATETSNK